MPSRAPILCWLACLLMAWCGAPAPLQGALAWVDPEQSVIPKLSDQTVDFSYRFTNDGAVPVTITEVRPSCSCTVARLAKTIFAPGEAGTLSVTFTVGTRTGTITKTVTVTCSDQQHPTTVLSLRVAIPVQAAFTHRLLTWILGSPPTPQEADVTIPDGVDMRIERLVVKPGKGPSCTATLRTLAAGHAYSISITPSAHATDAVGVTIIEVVTNLKTYRLYARVAAPRQPAHAGEDAGPGSPAPVGAAVPTTAP